MQIEAYLQRLNCSGPVHADADTLRRLHLAHLLAVPFENLSIHRREPIVLDDESLFEKIVRRRRGGFCYELNGLFAALLRALGFDVAMLSAGVATKDGGFGPEFDHMTLLVQLDERYLVDVGFGESFREPLRFDDRSEQREGERAYRIDELGGRFVLMRLDDGTWMPQYRFHVEPFVYADYEPMCRYHQTSPSSHFTRERLCSLATEDGRVTLSGMKLIRARHGHREEQQLSSDAEYADVLERLFGISVS